MRTLTSQFASLISRAFAIDSRRSVNNRRRRQRPAPTTETLECRALLTIDLLSVTAGATAGSLISENPQLSRNGRFVAFQSRAEDLALTGAIDGNGEQDIFVRDLELGTTTLISVNAGGRSGNGDSWSPSISDDGRFISFSSFATDLVTDVTYLSGTNAFVYDRDSDKDGIFDESGETRMFLLSRSAADPSFSGNSASGGIVPGADYALRTVMSGNGSTIVFGSLATNLLDPSDGVVDPFALRDLYYSTAGGEPRLVTVNADGTAAGVYAGGQSGGLPSVNFTGTRIAFESADFNLVEDDTEGFVDVFVRDETVGRTRRVSVNSKGEGGNGTSFTPLISRDGNHVVYGSFATNLIADDLNSTADIFVHDLRSGITSLVSRNRVPMLAGATGSASSPPSGATPKDAYAISDTGRYIVFASLATNLLDPVGMISDTNDTADVFWFDRDADADGIYDETSPGSTSTKLVSINAAGTATSNSPFATGGSSAVSISRDGRYVIFTSPGTDLIDGGTSGTAVYLRDMFSESTSLIGLTGVPGAVFAGVAESGLALGPLRAAFASFDATLDPSVTDSNVAIDVFSYDAPTDIIATSAGGDGFGSISVGYRIENKPAPVPFEVGVYRSADGEFDVGTDELLDTFMISGSGLSVGRKMLTFPIGSGPGEIALPGAGTTETDVDYQILFVFDHLDVIAELDTDAFNGDNAVPFAGSYHPDGGAVFVHGRQGPGTRANDKLVVTEPDAATIIVTNNGKTVTYAASDVTGIRFRGHAGDDLAITKGTPDLLLGGSGADKLFAGAGDDILGGGPGADALYGEAGFDLFYDGMGDDKVDLGPDGGEILTTPGSDDIFTGGGGESTLNFSLDDQPITIDLDSPAIQQVDPQANTVTLIGEWRNFVGSPFDDTVRVKPKDVLLRLNGGLGNDLLIIDAGGDSAFYDGLGTITFGSFSPLTVEGFEALSIVNAAARIIDDSDPVNFSHDGFFDSNPNFPQGFNGGVKFSTAGSGHTAFWTFRNLVPGRYGVAATWTNAPDRAKDSPFTIRDGGSSAPVLAQVDLNQEPAPNDFIADGFAWELLSNVTVSGNTLTVQLADDADQFVTADAIRIVPLSHSLVSDNQMAGFTGTGTIQNTSGLMGSQRVSNPGPGSTVATWTLGSNALPYGFVPGPYHVSATWSPVVGGATNAPFTVGDGTVSQTIRLDQRVAPGGVVDVVPWEPLGTFEIDSFFDVFVSLGNDADGIVIADAIRLEPAPVVAVLQYDEASGQWIPVISGGTVDLGPVPLNDNSGLAEQTTRFAIRNDGIGDLILGPITVTGDDYGLLNPLPTNSLRPGDIIPFDVRLRTGAVGPNVGGARFDTNSFANQVFEFGFLAHGVVDDAPPTVSVVEPTGDVVVIAGPTIAIRAEAIDDLGVERVEFLVNGQSFVDDSAPYSFEFSFEIGQLPPAQLNVQVTAFDLSGDSAVDVGTYRVEPVAPPRVELQMPTNGTSPFLEGVTLPVIIDAVDHDRISRVDLIVNGTFVATQDGIARQFLLPQLQFNGPATVFATVTDLFGQVSPSPPLFFVPGQPLSFIAPTSVAPFQIPPSDLLTPLIQWNSLPGAQGYELFIRNLRTQLATIPPRVQIPEYRVMDQLQQGTNRIWVRAIDANGIRLPWSDPYDLEIDVTNPPASKPLFSITTPEIDPTPEFRLLSESDSSSPLMLSTFDTIDVFIRDRTVPRRADIVLRGLRSGVIELEQGLLPDSYLVWVRRGNTAGELGPWSDPVEMNITTPALVAPVVTGPSGLQDVSPPVILWESVNFGDHYSVFIRRTDRAQSDLHVQGAEGLSHTPQTALPNGNYLVWVRAFSSAGVMSPWSQPLSFSISVPVPQQVTLIGPSGNIATGSPTFSWQPVAYAKRYVLWLTNLDTNQHPVLLESNLEDTQFVPTIPLPSGNYRFWVRAINSVGAAGPWSEFRSFTIDV